MTQTENTENAESADTFEQMLEKIAGVAVSATQMAKANIGVSVIRAVGVVPDSHKDYAATAIHAVLSEIVLTAVGALAIYMVERDAVQARFAEMIKTEAGEKDEGVPYASVGELVSAQGAHVLLTRNEMLFAAIYSLVLSDDDDKKATKIERATEAFDTIIDLFNKVRDGGEVRLSPELLERPSDDDKAETAATETKAAE